jgi:hypothetical protein
VIGGAGGSGNSVFLGRQEIALNNGLEILIIIEER